MLILNLFELVISTCELSAMGCEYMGGGYLSVSE